MTISSERVLDIFRETGALLEGHFVYTSGRHGRYFLQAARVLQYPHHTESLCRALADRFHGDSVDLVVGPAMGGIILAYETARHLACRAAYTEKDGPGTMSLRRGFRLDEGTRVLVVEDIVTTGGSVRKSLEHLQDRGAVIIGVGALIDRSGGDVSFAVPFRPLASINLESYEADDPRVEAIEGDPVDPDELMG